jgi:hypothetical protein
MDTQKAVVWVIGIFVAYKVWQDVLTAKKEQAAAGAIGSGISTVEGWFGLGG